MKKRTLSNLTTVSGNRDALILANKSWKRTAEICSWYGQMQNRKVKDIDAYTEFIFKLGWDSALLDIPKEKIDFENSVVKR